MGAWGAGLYQSDTGSDLKGTFRRLARLPYSGPRLAAMMVERHSEADDPDNEDHTTFWLVLADQFHRYGIEDPETFARAVSIIESGADDSMMAELDMDGRDRAKRRAQLEALKVDWFEGNPKPQSRRLLKAPEPFLVEAGDIWVLPTQDGTPPNTYMPAAWIDENFRPDGWAAFAVAANRHQFGWFAASFVVRLHVDGRERPTLRACLDAPVSGTRYEFMRDEPPSHVAGWVEITRSVLKKLRAERIGSVVFDEKAVGAHINGFELDEGEELGSLCGQLDCWQREFGSTAWTRMAEPLDVRIRELLEVGGE